MPTPGANTLVVALAADTPLEAQKNPFATPTLTVATTTAISTDFKTPAEATAAIGKSANEATSPAEMSTRVAITAARASSMSTQDIAQVRTSLPPFQQTSFDQGIQAAQQIEKNYGKQVLELVRSFNVPLYKADGSINPDMAGKAVIDLNRGIDGLTVTPKPTALQVGAAVALVQKGKDAPGVQTNYDEQVALYNKTKTGVAFTNTVTLTPTNPPIPIAQTAKAYARDVQQVLNEALATQKGADGAPQDPKGVASKDLLEPLVKQVGLRAACQALAFRIAGQKGLDDALDKSEKGMTPNGTSQEQAVQKLVRATSVKDAKSIFEDLEKSQLINLKGKERKELAREPLESSASFVAAVSNVGGKFDEKLGARFSTEPSPGQTVRAKLPDAEIKTGLVAGADIQEQVKARLFNEYPTKKAANEMWAKVDAYNKAISEIRVSDRPSEAQWKILQAEKEIAVRNAIIKWSFAARGIEPPPIIDAVNRTDNKAGQILKGLFNKK